MDKLNNHRYSCYSDQLSHYKLVSHHLGDASRTGWLWPQKVCPFSLDLTLILHNPWPEWCLHHPSVLLLGNIELQRKSPETANKKKKIVSYASKRTNSVFFLKKKIWYIFFMIKCEHCKWKIKDEAQRDAIL